MHVGLCMRELVNDEGGGVFVTAVVQASCRGVLGLLYESQNTTMLEYGGLVRVPLGRPAVIPVFFDVSASGLRGATDVAGRSLSI